jgi:hypothetical protein
MTMPIPPTPSRLRSWAMLLTGPQVFPKKDRQALAAFLKEVAEEIDGYRRESKATRLVATESPYDLSGGKKGFRS